MSKKSIQLLISQIIRVNQAGEYGAKRIYQGQLSQTTDKKQRAVLEHMAQQEEEHLKFFNEQMVMHGIRPTCLHPLWHIGGYLMGAVTAKIDPKLAHACTIAVEEVIDDHYNEQLKKLEFFPEHQALKTAIEKFKQEEQDHQNIAIDEGGNDHLASFLVKKIVGAITKTAIHLSKTI
jgi:ubiquinone biosynthesis monooxygenase Coq7